MSTELSQKKKKHGIARGPPAAAPFFMTPDARREAMDRVNSKNGRSVLYTHNMYCIPVSALPDNTVDRILRVQPLILDIIKESNFAGSQVAYRGRPRPSLLSGKGLAKLAFGKCCDVPGTSYGTIQQDASSIYGLVKIVEEITSR